MLKFTKNQMMLLTVDTTIPRSLLEGRHLKLAFLKIYSLEVPIHVCLYEFLRLVVVLSTIFVLFKINFGIEMSDQIKNCDKIKLI